MFIRKLCRVPRENPRRYAIRYAKCTYCATRPPTRPERERERETRFNIRIYLFYHTRVRMHSARGVSWASAVLRSEVRSQKRRSQFCATSMSRMSSIAGAFRLAYTANDRYPDARIMDVLAARRTPRMQRIVVMRDGRRRCVCVPRVSRKSLDYLYC